MFGHWSVTSRLGTGKSVTFFYSVCPSAKVKYSVPTKWKLWPLLLVRLKALSYLWKHRGRLFHCLRLSGRLCLCLGQLEGWLLSPPLSGSGRLFPCLWLSGRQCAYLRYSRRLWHLKGRFSLCLWINGRLCLCLCFIRKLCTSLW
jgi:hypothetical protein